MENIEKTENVLEIAQKNFESWNDALQTKDAKKVAALYSPDATFLPTMLGEFKSGQEGAESYFEHFLLKNPRGTIIEDKVQSITPDSYLHSGHYNFELGPDNDRQISEARFSFLWSKVNGEWKIIHHHSSVKPQA
jgi:uncharacterized protein (TIGR02246 family)